MTGTDPGHLIDALRDPAAWPWPAHEVQIVETHISHVFIADDRVVKVKRPVHYSFVDYSTLEKRHQACLDEVRLNRLLADDIYLGVVPILREEGGYRIGEPDETGDVVEWATLMRRIDDEEILDQRLSAGSAPPDLAERLADRLVPFHAERPPYGQDDPDTTLRTQVQVVTDNLDELQPFAGDALPAGELAMVDRAMRDFISTHEDILRDRATGGWIREGHGDLRCEHVVVPETGQVQVFDCVEFNVDLRRADVASDLAFLLMDLFRLGADPGITPYLLNRYHAAGIGLPVALLRMYWIHRALVRAKVHALQLADLDGDERIGTLRKAVDYLHVAFRQAIEAGPGIIAMTGLSGTGKSTVAKPLARATGAEYIASDEVRKELARQSGGREEDIYTADWTDRTYTRMLERARRGVVAGRLVVLDATFLTRPLRERAASVARDVGVSLIFVETVSDDDVIVQRLEEREQRADSISDAGVEVYRRQRDRQQADPPGIPDGAIHVTLDTTPSEPASLKNVLDVLVSAGVIVPGIREMGGL